MTNVLDNKIKIKPFYCQKVIPLVFDDSLSYYEQICKLVHYTNEVVKQINDLTDYINVFVSTLPIDELVRASFNKLVEEGYFDDRLQELLDQLTQKYDETLEEHTNDINDLKTRMTNEENSLNALNNQVNSSKVLFNKTLNDVDKVIQKDTWYNLFDVFEYTLTNAESNTISFDTITKEIVFNRSGLANISGFLGLFVFDVLTLNSTCYMNFTLKHDDETTYILKSDLLPTNGSIPFTTIYNSSFEVTEGDRLKLEFECTYNVEDEEISSDTPIYIEKSTSQDNITRIKTNIVVGYEQ